MILHDLVAKTVEGLGYELVEIERIGGGLLRVTIDLPWAPCAQSSDLAQLSITVDDCEKVTRQLQYVFEVEDVAYQRLEVSSPGIDRLLRHDADCERFAGNLVDVTLRNPIEQVSALRMPVNKKKFRGMLEKVQIMSKDAVSSAPWRIVWSDEPAHKSGHRVSKHRKPAPLLSLDFYFDEIKEIRLAPVVSFKGR